MLLWLLLVFCEGVHELQIINHHTLMNFVVSMVLTRHVIRMLLENYFFHQDFNIAIWLFTLLYVKNNLKMFVNNGIKIYFHCMTSNKILHIKASFMGLEKSI